MALVLADRVKETTTTTGTGTVTLAGAVTGYQSFSVIGNGNTTYYTIADPTGADWEVGIGTYTASGTTLARTTVLASSNSGALVSFGAGAKDVFVTYPSEAVLAGVTQSATPFETSLGSGAGTSVTGINNTQVGYNAGNAINTGTDNVLLGTDAGKLVTTGAYNVAIGSTALDAATTGSGFTAVGYGALTSSTYAGGGTAVGQFALSGATTGGENTAVGMYALSNMTTASDNIAVGYFAGSSLFGAQLQGNKNVAIGNYSLTGFLGDFNSTSAENCAIGYSAMSDAYTADYCVAVGAYALGTQNNDLQGDYNAAIGHSAGRAVTTGAQNTMLGANAAYSGTNNLTTGSNNTVIGYNASTSSATVSNTVTLGNSSITTLRCQVTTITALSDARDKANIQDLSAGIDFIKALRAVSFDWNMRDGGKVGVADTGFIAQELKSAQEVTGIRIPGLVDETNPERLEAGYGKLLPVLVKAIQELSAKVESLEAQLKG